MKSVVLFVRLKIWQRMEHADWLVRYRKCVIYEVYDITNCLINYIHYQLFVDMGQLCVSEPEVLIDWSNIRLSILCMVLVPGKLVVEFNNMFTYLYM